jgi:outer membrane protease
MYGTGILYEQAFLIGLFGIRASYDLFDAFSIRADVSFSPLAWCYAEDNHLARSVDFYSKLSGGLMFEPGLSFAYALSEGARLELSAAYRLLYSLLGDLSQVNQGVTSTASDGNYYAGPDSAQTTKHASGASISMLDIGLSLRMVF